MRIVIFAAAAVSAMSVSSFPVLAHADMIASASNNQCLANQGGAAVLQVCSNSRHNANFPYKSGENVFYGALNIGGQCLDVRNRQQVVFAACNGSKTQTWKLAGATTQLNNEDGVCIAGSGSSVAVRPCPANGSWRNASYFALPGLPATVARGTPLKILGGDVVNSQTGAVVDKGGAAAIVSHDSGGIISHDSGGLVAAGGGNVVAGPGASGLVASGGGN